MTEKEYLKRLAKAPPQTSEEFLKYLRENNVVVKESTCWLIIENCKYHKKGKPFHTAFYKRNGTVQGLTFLSEMYKEWEWLKKDLYRQTIPTRFHIHFYRNKK